MTVFEKAKTFIYKNARPLDLFRFQFLFENGSKENVLATLKMYQNNDCTWNVTWNWTEYMEQWNVAKNWWYSDIIISNLKYM